MNTDRTDTYQDADFGWQLQGRIIVLDNGARLPFQKNFDDLIGLNALATIVFDPASRLHDHERLQHLDEFQVFPHALLGNGEQTTLYACMDPTRSGTLEPLMPEQLPEAKRDGAFVLARLPISSVRLDDIEGLSQVDWLLLDECNDSLAALENGTKYLKETLLVHVRISLMPTYQRQPDVPTIFQWMTRHGYQCYQLNQPSYYSHLPREQKLEREQATQLDTVEAIFIPDEHRLACLPITRLRKLAFLMDAVHGGHDFTYRLLNKIDAEMATHYLATRGYLSQYDTEPEIFSLTAKYSPAPWAGQGQQLSRTPQ